MARVVFVAHAEQAPSPAPGTTVLVLDTAWTARPGERPDLVPLRGIVSPILANHDLFSESLTRLDAWVGEAGLDGILTEDGIAWWYRIRAFIWYSLHEAILWRRVIAALEAREAPDLDAGPLELVIPSDRPLLEAAATATARTGAIRVTVADSPSVAADAAGAPATHGSTPPVADPSGAAVAEVAARRVLSLAVRLARRVRRFVRNRRVPEAPPSRESDLRTAAIDRRVAALANRPGTVLAIAYPRVFQVLGKAGDETRADPQLGPVLDRLAAQGLPIAMVGIGLEPRRDADWTTVEADDRLIPDSWLRARCSQPTDAEIHSTAIASAVSAIDTPLLVDSVDLAPAVVAAVRRYVPRWLDGQRRELRQVERFYERLRPAAVFLNHEGNRTPWVAAARRLGIPVIAIQHGVIYPTHPVYRHPRLATIPLADVTCVFGEFERETLLEHGGYTPAEVVVTGSPRQPEDVGADLSASERAVERAAVRTALGVGPDDRLLVVSSANMWIMRDVHLVELLARTLGGPLPGVHVVVKQHPGETDDGPVRNLLEGLAAAGGYAPPPITVVHDIDLLRLLRAADGHLSFASTVLTDAVMTKTPNLVSSDQAYGDLIGYMPARVARSVSRPEDVRAALEDPRPPSEQDRSAFLARHFRDGDAVGRVAAEIRSRIDGRAAGG